MGLPLAQEARSGEPRIIQAEAFPVSALSLAPLLLCCWVVIFRKSKVGDRERLSGSHPVRDSKPLPVHLGNIVTEGSHPLRFDAGD